MSALYNTTQNSMYNCMDMAMPMPMMSRAYFTNAPSLAVYRNPVIHQPPSLKNRLS